MCRIATKSAHCPYAAEKDALRAARLARRGLYSLLPEPFGSLQARFAPWQRIRRRRTMNKFASAAATNSRSPFFSSLWHGTFQFIVQIFRVTKEGFERPVTNVDEYSGREPCRRAGLA
jgi:hypothetical protein